ncbi:MAG: AAA family ATPase [Bdellovibrio sp.]|nr:AAA family ATPase [Bdellovibrio sp.]
MIKGLFLKTLTLKNFATFEDCNINFADGLNCIIGETGSGKSLILDALQIIFGHRADKKIIRKGTDGALIEAIFVGNNNPQVKEFFDHLGFPFQDGEVVIKRLISIAGPNKCFLNFQACQTSHLTDVANFFIDFVGQFENQKLLSEEYHLQLIDHYIKDINLAEYRKTFSILQNKREELRNLQVKASERIQKKDFLTFQIEELRAFNPSADDEFQILVLKEKIINKEQILGACSQINAILVDEDLSIASGLIKIMKAIEKSKLALSENLAGKLHEFRNFIDEFTFELSKIADIYSDENLDINFVLERLDRYQKLKRKYNCDANGLQLILERFEQELASIEIESYHVNELEIEINKYEQKANNLACVISEKRRNAACEISKHITLGIQQLNMVGAKLNISLESNEHLSITGRDQIHFMVETNPGEGMHRIKEIASGGELSRILLSIRRVFSVKDSISIFLFDEIESGIGGETALKIGAALKDVAKHSQVIVITHLPQIAVNSDKITEIVKQTRSSQKDDCRTISIAKDFTYKNQKELYAVMAPMQMQ